MQTTLILTCAGKGERAEFNKNKLLVEFMGSTALQKTLSVFFDSGLINQYIITASETDYQTVKELVGAKCTVVLGGSTRTQSVKNALKHASGDIVLIHDGARPFVTKEVISNCIESVKKYGSGITAVPSRDTVCQLENDNKVNYLGKDKIYSIQTPQGFYLKDIVKAYDSIGDKTYNDDGEIYKAYFGNVALCQGDFKNKKLTFKQDFAMPCTEYRYGTGFDCHKLVERRKLILGGITIPHEKGLLGHSDADVLTHAIMDSILSACAMRDIGYHFSDKSPEFKDICSMELLQRVLDMIKEKSYKLQSVSACIMAEKPKLLNFIPIITDNLSKALCIEKDKIGITATTLEGLGFVGREEGICVSANSVVCKM